MKYSARVSNIFLVLRSENVPFFPGEFHSSLKVWNLFRERAHIHSLNGLEKTSHVVWYVFASVVSWGESDATSVTVIHLNHLQWDRSGNANWFFFNLCTIGRIMVPKALRGQWRGEPNLPCRLDRTESAGVKFGWSDFLLLGSLEATLLALKVLYISVNGALDH